MSLKSRINQNKPQRDEQNAKERTDLKRENQRLKKQVGRLRKQLAKLVELYGIENVKFEEEAEEPISMAEAEGLSQSAGDCPKCGGITKESEYGGKMYSLCTVKGCLWRKKV